MKYVYVVYCYDSVDNLGIFLTENLAQEFTDKMRKEFPDVDHWWLREAVLSDLPKD